MIRWCIVLSLIRNGWYLVVLTDTVWYVVIIGVFFCVTIFSASESMLNNVLTIFTNSIPVHHLGKIVG